MDTTTMAPIRFAGRIGGIGLVVVSLWGCGHSAPTRRAASAKPVPAPARTTTQARAATPRPATPCLPAPREAMARFLGVAPGRVTQAASTGNNSMPQCTFAARYARVRAIANVDDGSQPYFVLDRAATEAAQQFTTSRMIAAPEAVTGLGLEADWFPAERQLMATDGIRLITVSVIWGHSDQTRRRRLAEAVVRPYLRRRTGPAKGYP